MRLENYTELVHRIIANTLVQKVANEELKTVTISDVSVSPDRQHVDIFVNSVDKAKAVKELNSIKGLFRNQIAQNIQAKKTPHINFLEDNLPEQIEAIENTLKIAKKNKKRNSFNAENYKKTL